MSGRIRTIKPEWLEDELIASEPDHVRLLTIGLILLADDHGCGRAAVNFIASEVWKYDRSPEVLTKVREGLMRLSGAGENNPIRFIRLYEVDGQSYFEIRSWSRHQKVQHTGARRVPAPPGEAHCKLPKPRTNSARGSRESLTKVPETLTNVPEGLTSFTESLTPDLRSPISDHDHHLAPQASTRDDASPVATPKRGTRCPSSVDLEAPAWCAKHGIPDPIQSRESAKMLDYFASAPGQRGLKLNWSATWRNWERTANERGGTAGFRRAESAPNDPTAPPSKPKPKVPTPDLRWRPKPGEDYPDAQTVKDALGTRFGLSGPPSVRDNAKARPTPQSLPAINGPDVDQPTGSDAE